MLAADRHAEVAHLGHLKTSPLETRVLKVKPDQERVGPELLVLQFSFLLLPAIVCLPCGQPTSTFVPQATSFSIRTFETITDHEIWITGSHPQYKAFRSLPDTLSQIPLRLVTVTSIFMKLKSHPGSDPVRLWAWFREPHAIRLSSRRCAQVSKQTHSRSGKRGFPAAPAQVCVPKRARNGGVREHTASNAPITLYTSPPCTRRYLCCQ